MMAHRNLRWHGRGHSSPFSSSNTSSAVSSSNSSSTESSTGPEGIQKFNHQLSRLGLILHSVPSDGNCLFSAFADQLTGRVSNHDLFRTQAVNYLRDHRHEMRPFCSGGSYKEMLQQLAQDGTYGDHMSIVALARVHHVDVIVHQLGQPPRLVARGCSSSSPLKQVHLAYHDDIEHYSSVRYIDGPFSGPALVQTDLRSLKSTNTRSPTRRRKHSHHISSHH